LEVVGTFSFTSDLSVSRPALGRQPILGFNEARGYGTAVASAGL